MFDLELFKSECSEAARSEWDPERLVEQPGDVQRTLQLFEESNRLYTARP